MRGFPSPAKCVLIKLQLIRASEMGAALAGRTHEQHKDQNHTEHNFSMSLADGRSHSGNVVR